ncbi:hypothetical protein BO70DRAFT_431649 [Aspergillus heteromorphus CBS 117.55]|uniref:Uncharacterized protein n=1 Tax=Aspergillus heteromorphus CBS 117.55 TaxID=1448321 RepID=A0A317VGW7_9EURO|nr:uncharacterized protein BO70DRAFT_431649 [Aspergillus heteromorphus CBS 117.55]PWY72258.1 hypothetical protein BO70DRAFT_431649 [Aspergillus heteromorphus CBS 117.55]
MAAWDPKFGRLYVCLENFQIIWSESSSDGTVQGATATVVLQPNPTDHPNDPLTWSKLRKATNLALVNFYAFGLSARRACRSR